MGDTIPAVKSLAKLYFSPKKEAPRLSPACEGGMAQVPPSEYTLIRLFPDITFYRFTSDIVSITESCGGQSRTGIFPINSRAHFHLCYPTVSLRGRAAHPLSLAVRLPDRRVFTQVRHLIGTGFSNDSGPSCTGGS